MQRILIVEDDPTFRSVLESVIAGPERSVVSVGNAEDALSLLADAEHMDAVVADLLLPDKADGGFWVLEAARARFPGCRVLVITGTDRPVSKFPVLRKPFAADDLHAALA